MDLSVLIVNYKSANLLKDCLRSIYDSVLKIEYEIIVVNNDRPEEINEVSKIYGSNISIIQNPHNIGFAGGNNAGIKISQGKAILLLNPDTKVNFNDIQILFDTLMQNDTIGIVGPKIYYGDGSLQSRFIPKRIPIFLYLFCEMFYLDKIFSHSKLMNSYFGADFDYDAEQEVEQVCGACFMIKKSVVETIGMMDERFFLYFDEADWCLRTIRAGFKVLYVPKASIIHFEGQSSIGVKRKSVENYYRMQLCFFRKYHGVVSTLFLYLLNLLGFTFRIITIPFYLIKDRNTNKVLRHLWALIYHLNINNLLSALKTYE